MPDIRIEGASLIRRLIEIDPAAIVVDIDANSRANSHQRIEELALDFLENGQKQPVGVRRIDGVHIGNLEPVKLTWGVRRYLAGMHINNKDLTGKHRPSADTRFLLTAVVGEQEEDEAAFLDTLAENENRVDLTAIDYATRVIPRLESFGRTRAEIAKIIHRSEGWISETLSLLDLPAWCQAYVASGALAASTAYDLAKIPEPVRTSVLQWVKREAGNVSRNDIQRALAGYLQRPLLAHPSDMSAAALDAGAVAQYGDGPTGATGDDPPSAIAAQETPSPIPDSERADLAGDEAATGVARSLLRLLRDDYYDSPLNPNEPIPAPAPAKKRKPIKPPKLKARTVAEIRAAYKEKSDDERTAPKIRELFSVLDHYAARSIGEQKMYNEVEKLVRRR
jgi:ParB/RepB/Spo0J family partition protein